MERKNIGGEGQAPQNKNMMLIRNPQEDMIQLLGRTSTVDDLKDETEKLFNLTKRANLGMKEGANFEEVWAGCQNKLHFTNDFEKVLFVMLLSKLFSNLTNSLMGNYEEELWEIFKSCVRKLMPDEAEEALARTEAEWEARHAKCTETVH